MKRNKRVKALEMIKEHIIHNKKEYFLVFLLFVIGIFLGVFFINHVQEAQKAEITEYFNNFINKMKATETLDYTKILKASIGQNLLLAIVLWFFGTTVIGIPVVFRLSDLSRILLGLYDCYLCYYDGATTGHMVCANSIITAKYFVGAGNTSLSR